MKLIMTPKEARKKVLFYKGIIKDIEKKLSIENYPKNVIVGLSYLLRDYKIKLDWAVSDYKLALKKNAC